MITRIIQGTLHHLGFNRHRELPLEKPLKSPKSPEMDKIKTQAHGTLYTKSEASYPEGSNIPATVLFYLKEDNQGSIVKLENIIKGAFEGQEVEIKLLKPGTRIVAHKFTTA